MEIKTNDLRIGNLINDDNVVIKITRDNVVCLFRGQYYNTFESDEISGIPLTEELLLKMGFVAIGTSGNTEYFSLDEWDIDFYEGEWHVNLASQSLTSIKYVHQLMNLYHALTGQELTLS